jgi:hypothetical protein
MNETCAWVLIADDGSEVEKCDRTADVEWTVTADDGSETPVPFCDFHATVVGGVVL